MDINKALGSTNSKGTFRVEVLNGKEFSAVIVAIIPVADGGAILAGRDGINNVTLGQPQLEAGTHEVEFNSTYQANASVDGTAYVGKSGQMTITVDGTLTTAKGTFTFETKDGDKLSGEFDIVPI